MSLLLVQHSGPGTAASVTFAGGSPSPGRTVIYQALAFVAVVAAAPAPPLDGWNPDYPNAIPGKPGLATAHHQFLTEPILPPPAPFAWLPVYPDQTRAKAGLPTQQQRAYFGPELQPFPRPGWTPTYQDWLPRSVLPTAEHPAFFYTSALPNLPPPPLTWQPVYPDTHRRALQLPAADQQSSAYTSSLPQLPVPALAWEGVFPDQSPARVLPTADQQALAFVRAIVPSTVEWIAQHPSLFVVPRLPVLGGWVGPILPPPPPPYPQLQYPSQFFPIRLPVLGGWAGPILPPPPPPFPPAGYPSQFFPVRLPVLGGWSGAILPPPPPPFPQGLYPATFRAPQGVLPPVWVAPIFPPAAVGVPFDWLGIAYPTSNEAWVTVELGRSALIAPPEIPQWQPAYPSLFGRILFVPPAGAVAPFFTTATVPLLSWQPSYPTPLLPRAAVLGPASGAGAILPPTPPPLNWQGSYPSIVLRPRLTAGPSLAEPVLPPTGLSWLPVYPAQFWRPQTQILGGSSLVALVTGAVAPPLWLPSYPNFFVLSRLATGASVYAWTGPNIPPVIPPATACTLIVVSSSFGTHVITGTIVPVP